MPISPEKIVGSELIDIYEKLVANKRLSFDDGLRLYQTPNLTAVGYLANYMRESKHGKKTYFVRNQHINYTNICNKFCKFCCFYAKKGGPDPYEMTVREVEQKIKKYLQFPITEIHMVGGVNPRLSYQYYLDIIQAIKKIRPEVYVKAFTAVEIAQIAQVGKVSIDQAICDLKEAGLDSTTGGGIEILSERVHQEIFDRKLDGNEWKEVARATKRAGMPQYATMLYGHIETVEERVDHLVQLRELQDETGHFVAMTPLSFHPENTDLDYISAPTGDCDLRNIAVSRLMLDNIDHIKSFWIMNSVPITQMALWYGADDADGLVQEYEITYKEGDFGNKSQALTYENMIHMIQEVGRTPIERDSFYNELQPNQMPAGNQKIEKNLTLLPII
jgi:aminodeoxyfutalosine synthase